MIDDPPCPLCGTRAWRRQRPVAFDRASPPALRAAQRQQYVALRRKVLFDVWFPAADKVQLTPQSCAACGFVCYSPRPDANDLQAKYDYLGLHERTGTAIGADPREAEFDRRRAQRAFRLLTARMPAARSVLDVGGGDGRLLSPFIEAGLQCHVLDHNPRPVPGVTRIGAIWDEVPANLQFDMMICNHVLEHVTDPVGFAQQALQRLAPGGHAYFEIPLEIWRTVPIDPDPVTHINFFHRRTLCHALRRAGYEICQSRTMGGTYAQWRLPVAWAVVRAADRVSTQHTDERAAALTRRLIDPPWHTRAWHRGWLQPQVDGSLARLQSLPERGVARLQRLLHRK